MQMRSPAVHTRALQGTPPAVTFVNTAEGLLGAVAQGYANIEIQAHLNLTNVTPNDIQACNDDQYAAPCVSSQSSMLGQVPHTVQSIRVRFLSTFKLSGHWRV